MAERDPHVLHPGHHPTPFTAAEIRDASRLGGTVRQVIEIEGAPTQTLVQHIVEIDGEGGTRYVYTLGANGEPVDPGRSRATWLALQGHASMPTATTTIDEVALDTPMGRLDCLRYTRRDGDALDVFWFARSKPGMPVRIERVEDGRVVRRVTMISNEVLPLPDEDSSAPNPD